MKCSFCKQNFTKNTKIVTLLVGSTHNGEHVTYNTGIPEALHICENDLNMGIDTLLSIFNLDGWKP
jgi:hypothetical protein